MRGLCQKCHRSNAIIDTVDGYTVCFRCQGKHIQVSHATANHRKCVDCEFTWDYRQSGMGTRKRCEICSKRRRLWMQRINDAKYRKQRKINIGNTQ